jgi:hypothetical protein
MVKGILKRKRVLVVTGHGKVLVFLERHAPWLVAFLAKMMGVDKRSERPD